MNSPVQLAAPRARRTPRLAVLAGGILAALMAVPLASPATAVEGVNNPPVANPDFVSMQSGQTVNVDVMANDTDPDGDPLTLEEAWLPLPEAGTARAVDGKVRIKAAADFVGSVAITYRISDGRGGLANGVLTVEVTPAAPVNAKPLPVTDEVRTNAGQPVTIPVLGNDSDPEGGPITLVAVGRAKHGSAVISGDTIVYTPKAGFAGRDSFSYTVADPQGRRAKARVIVTVVGEPSPQPPPTGAPSRRDVEQALDRLGLPTGKANGHYDAKTRRAMCAWRTVAGETASRKLPSAAEARAIVAMSDLPRALGSMVTGLNISKTCQVAFWVSSADNYRAVMPATTGRAGLETRSGIHRVFISWHVWRYSTIYEGARMYKPMQFSGGQAVHGSAHDSYVKTHPASHGCVRMLHRDIDRLQGGGFGLGSTVRVFGHW